MILQGIFHGILQLQYGGLIAAPVAVVGSGENGDHVVIVTPVESFHDQLVGSGHQNEFVGVIESLGNILSEGVASSTGRPTPSAALFRIGPEQIAHRTLSATILASSTRPIYLYTHA